MFSRREFLKASAATLALATLSPEFLWAETAVPKRQIKKAIMWATVGFKGSILEKMKAVKEAGFDGAEMMSHLNVEEVLRARDETGLAIPSVCDAVHWNKPLS